MCVVAETEVCYRSHTEKVSADHVKGGGKEWDTVKPLHKWFKHMHRVLLMDDDAYKVCTLPHLGRNCMSAYLNCAASATVDNNKNALFQTFCNICCRIVGTLVEPDTFQ